MEKYNEALSTIRGYVEDNTFANRPLPMSECFDTLQELVDKEKLNMDEPKLKLLKTGLWDEKCRVYIWTWINPLCIVSLEERGNGEYLMKLVDGQIGSLTQEEFRELTGIYEPIHLG